VRHVIGVAGVEHRAQKLFFGLEVMQQADRDHARFLRDLAERGATPAIARHQTLRHGEDPLPPVLALGVSPLIGHETPFNQPTDAH
jgi:hypothetical protein